MNSIIRDLTPKTNKPYLTKTKVEFLLLFKTIFFD